MRTNVSFKGLFMKNILFYFALCGGLAHAAPSDLSVKKFNFNYKNPSGEGSAAAFSRSGSGAGEVKVAVEKIDESLNFRVTGVETHEFELKDAPAFILDAETMKVSNLNLETTSNLEVNLQSGQFNSKENSLKLEGLSLLCDKKASESEMDQFYQGCIQSLSLKTSRFTSAIVEEALTNAIAENVTVQSLDLKIKGGKYTLSTDVKASVSGKVKSNGTVAYDTAKGLLTLKISEVKFSILNITGKVFEELKKSESEKFKVKEPYVYITVK